MNALINAFIDGVVIFATNFLMPTMFITFLLAVVARLLVFYTVKRQEWFVKEFDKRVQRHIEIEYQSGSPRQQSFYVLCKKLLERTYYELFEMRAAMKRRKRDYIESPADRLFLIQRGSAWFVRDSLKNFRFLRKSDEDPNFVDIAKNIFKSNAPWNKVFGVVPVGPLNDLINLLAGTFIIGGIFGTFVGIMHALPELGKMDLSNMEQTKEGMNNFLMAISFKMATSILGIIFSVSLSVVNALCNPEKVFFGTVTDLGASLLFLWGRCETNEVPNGLQKFDEHKDPIEALAELAVAKELKDVAKADPAGARGPGGLPPPPKRAESGEAKKEAS